MAQNRISLAESALGDLEAIIAWYTEQGVREVGIRLVTEMLERIEVLGEHGELGRVVPEFAQPSLRELIHPPFRIVYRYEVGSEGDRIRIVRVWRGERALRLPDNESE